MSCPSSQDLFWLPVIMPPSALNCLAYLQIDYPILFEVSNPTYRITTHWGVLKFIADKAMIYFPYWMMENMLLDEGDNDNIKNASLSKGTFVKLQPHHTKDFLDVSNPEVIAFTGSSRQLDGPATESVCLSVASFLLKHHEPEKRNSTNGSTHQVLLQGSNPGSLSSAQMGTKHHMEHQKLRLSQRRAVRRSKYKRGKKPSSKHSQGRNIY